VGVAQKGHGLHSHQQWQAEEQMLQKILQSLIAEAEITKLSERQQIFN
jgi:hypothetical protein